MAGLNPTTEKILRAAKARWGTTKTGLLRDAFSGMAMLGLLASGRFDAADEARIARMAYSHADAMLAYRKTPESS